MIDPQWIASIKGWAASKPPIVRAYVFGSRARGDHRPESDLDIALVLEPECETALTTWLFEGRAWSYELAALLPVSIDLELMSDDDRVVGPAVREHGRVIYQRH